MSTGRLALVRILVVLTLVTGLNYLVWRWLHSVNWENWWIAVPWCWRRPTASWTRSCSG